MRHALLVLALLFIAVVPSTARQVDPSFDDALGAFESGSYEEAAVSFAAIADRHPDGPDATAARAMAGKALYRAGRYAEAVETLTAFLDRTPQSRYAPDVRRTLGLARDALRIQDNRPAELGVILSLTSDEVHQAQELFNGIHLAVDGYNDGADRPVRMVFREIGADPSSAGAAVRTLAAEGVRVIVGALFSVQALEAASAAESAGVVFLAPLATDEEVSKGRTRVFQANPTIEMRGRLMARMAVNGLRLDTLATVSGPDPTEISRRMVRGFLDEAQSLGADIPVNVRLESPGDWYRLDTILSADTLAGIRGLYLPITGSQTDRTAGAILSALDRMNVAIRVLGNSEWHDLPMVTQASKYTATYTNDYFPDPSRPEVGAFDRVYLDFTNTRPGRLAHAGYDVTDFLLEAAREVGLDGDADEIASSLRDMPAWEGVAHRIEFAGGQVNRSMFYHRYRDGRLELLR